jgi:predicted nucleic acid-binding protein
LRVYAESNFVLELTLEQEDAAACEEVLDLATQGALRLAIPAFALVEPFSTLEWRRRERRRLDIEARKHLKELARTQSLARRAESAADALTELMVSTAQVAAQRLREIRTELVAVADVLPLSSETFRKAEEVAVLYRLQWGDAMVLASILDDPELGTSPSCFLNRNTKDFGDDPLLSSHLEQHDCRLFDFVAGIREIHSRIRS